MATRRRRRTKGLNYTQAKLLVLASSTPRLLSSNFLSLRWTKSFLSSFLLSNVSRAFPRRIQGKNSRRLNHPSWHTTPRYRTVRDSLSHESGFFVSPSFVPRVCQFAPLSIRQPRTWRASRSASLTLARPTYYWYVLLVTPSTAEQVRANFHRLITDPSRLIRRKVEDRANIV